MEEPYDQRDAQVPQEDGHVHQAGRPETARPRALLSEDHSAEEFEVSLETLLDRPEMSLSP